MFDSLRQDVSGAIRGLIKSPGFAAASLITLALGIGATSAIFSVVKAVLITPLPYAQPERIVQLFTRWTAFEKTWLANAGGRRLPQHGEDRDRDRVVEFRTTEPDRRRRADPHWRRLRHRQHCSTCSARARCSGGVISAEEDAPNGPQVAVLGYPLWQARYGGDPSVIGRRLMINDVAVEVIGVMPQGFRLPTDFNDEAAEPTQLWRPIQWDLTQLVA